LNTRERCGWMPRSHTKIHGFSQEAAKSKDLKAQASQTDAGKSPQETFAL
jgi:hypothetical protein